MADSSCSLLNRSLYTEPPAEDELICWWDTVAEVMVVSDEQCVPIVDLGLTVVAVVSLVDGND